MKLTTIVKNYEDVQTLAAEYIKDKFNLHPLVSDFFDFAVTNIAQVNKNSPLYRILIDSFDENFDMIGAFHYDCDPKEFDAYAKAQGEAGTFEMERFSPDDLPKSTGSFAEALGLPEGSVTFESDHEDEEVCDCPNCTTPLSEQN